MKRRSKVNKTEVARQIFREHGTSISNSDTLRILKNRGVNSLNRSRLHEARRRVKHEHAQYFLLLCGGKRKAQQALSLVMSSR